MLRQTHTETSVAQRHWVDMGFHSHERHTKASTATLTDTNLPATSARIRQYSPPALTTAEQLTHGG